MCVQKHGTPLSAQDVALATSEENKIYEATVFERQPRADEHPKEEWAGQMGAHASYCIGEAAFLV